MYGIYNCYNDSKDGKVTAPISCSRTAASCAGAGGGPLGSIYDCLVGFIQNAIDCKEALSKGGGGAARAHTALVRHVVSHYQIVHNATQSLAVSASTSTATGADDLDVLNVRVGRVKDELDAFTAIFGVPGNLTLIKRFTEKAAMIKPQNQQHAAAEFSEKMPAIFSAYLRDPKGFEKGW